MKLTNRKILNDLNGLKSLTGKQLPVKASYAIAKNISKLESEAKIYEKERIKLLEKYCELDENSNIKANENGDAVFKEGCKEQWDKDINELMDIESDIDIHQFKLDQLEGCILSPAEIMLIDYMIEE